MHPNAGTATTSDAAALEHHVRELLLSEVVARGQACLAAADHDNVGFFRALRCQITLVVLSLGADVLNCYRRLQVSFVEGEHLLPAIHRLFLSVAWPFNREEPMTGPVVTMELIRLAERLSTSSVRLTWSGLGDWSSLPKMPRSGALMFSVRSIGATGRAGVSCAGSSTITPPPRAIDCCVDPSESACSKVSLAPSRAEANHANPAVRVGLRSQIVHASLDIAHDLVIRRATGSPRSSGHIVR